MSGIASRTRLITSSEFAVGSTQMPMNVARLPVEAHVLVVVLGAEHDVGDVAEPDDGAALSRLTTSLRNSSGVCRSVLAMRLTDIIEPLVRPSGREVVVRRERVAHLRRARCRARPSGRA